MKLEGASVVLTGASRGIGAALARALGARGARLVLVARSRAGLEAVAKDVRAAGGAAALVAGDVADPAVARAAVAQAVAAYTGVDLLVNNAAILAPPRPLVETTPEEWRSVLDVNVVGTVAFLREAIPHLAARGGVAVNLTSGWGRSADRNVASYVASKWAIEGLTRAVALEVPAGVAVVAVNPGVIATDMLAQAFGGDAAAYPSPEDLAPRFLALLERLGPRQNGRSLDA